MLENLMVLKAISAILLNVNVVFIVLYLNHSITLFHYSLFFLSLGEQVHK